MDRTLAATVEIQTIHELLPELDYYRILGLERDAPQESIAPAFRSESRRLHPDRFTSMGDADLNAKVNEVFRSLREAYSTLSDPDKRVVYDDELQNGSSRMSDDAHARADQQRAASNDPAEAATNEKSSKYWKMALKDLAEDNPKGAVMNIQFALSFEPNNELFKEYLTKAKVGAEEQHKKTYNPYKLRIS